MKLSCTECRKKVSIHIHGNRVKVSGLCALVSTYPAPLATQ